ARGRVYQGRPLRIHVFAVPARSRAGYRLAGEPDRNLVGCTWRIHMKADALLIDCDGHILEPPDLWEKYLDPKYRDRAMRIRVGDDRFEYLEIDGKRAK